MTATAHFLDLAPGSELCFDESIWTVLEVEPQLGRVLLEGSGGERQHRTIRWLMHHPTCRSIAAKGDSCTTGPSRQPAAWNDLTEYQQRIAHRRAAHVLEAETGFRSGDPRLAEAGEPRPMFDPATTTLGQRRRAKAAELNTADPEEAAMLGLGRMSERTLRRLAAGWREKGLLGCVDGRWLRVSTGRPSITEPVREAIFAVRKECKDRSRVSMRTKERMIHQYLLEKFGSTVEVPGYDTLRHVWRDWFGPGGARQRYVRTAETAETGTAWVVVHRPGQVVALDTTELPVKVRETVFGEPVSAHLTLALDLYTHSVVGFRLTLVSDTSVDVAMLLRDVMTPLPMREGWGQDMEWPYPGVPASVVAEFAGHPVAGLPFFAPETVTTDHGNVYKNHHVVAVQRVLQCNVLPARTLRATDKASCERTFGGIRSLLFEQLPGYTGVDVADRGADPEADAVLTISEMEHLIATWVVKIWQNRRLGEYAPSWGPGVEHSPNTLFAAAMQQGGFALRIPKPELYYELLPTHYVKIHGRRGVKIGGLWYDGDVLAPYRGVPSHRGGRHKGRWVVHSDPRDRRAVFFQDPESQQWHNLRWNGLPPEGEVPAFSTLTAQALLAEARGLGLAPRDDAALLPVLLELIGGKIPVTRWPTQMTKAERTSQAREVMQANAAAADRPVSSQPVPTAPAADVVDLRWHQRAQTTDQAVTAERRRRREAAVAGPLEPAPVLAQAQRRRNLFVLPQDDEPPQEPQGGTG